MKKILEEQLQKAREASQQLAKLSSRDREQLLLDIAQKLTHNKKNILAANAVDVREAENSRKTNAFINRLALTSSGFDGMLEQLTSVASQEDPLGENIEEKTLGNGVKLVKRRFPIGVILMVYESRPNVTIDAMGICVKSGNAVVLKGGSESKKTNEAMMQCVSVVLQKYKVPSAVTYLHDISHEEVAELLERSDLIDVVIPRGSESLTTAVAKESRIPILYHAAGGARMYIDKTANLEDSLDVALNGKTQRTGVCNALDCVVVHREIAKDFLPKLDLALFEKNFEIRADSIAKQYMPHAKEASEKDFSTEFLDSILAVKVVDSAREAIEYIKKTSHGHTEVLMANDNQVIDAFINEVDAAGLMINCSSRLHDGGQFAMGAEMGTATGKLHARGPVGVKELTTYKWIAYGNGQIRQ